MHRHCNKVPIFPNLAATSSTVYPNFISRRSSLYAILTDSAGPAPWQGAHWTEERLLWLTRQRLRMQPEQVLEHAITRITYS